MNGIIILLNQFNIYFEYETGKEFEIIIGLVTIIESMIKFCTLAIFVAIM